jgi:hypothetical protein
MLFGGQETEAKRALAGSSCRPEPRGFRRQSASRHGAGDRLRCGPSRSYPLRDGRQERRAMLTTSPNSHSSSKSPGALLHLLSPYPWRLLPATLSALAWSRTGRRIGAAGYERQKISESSSLVSEQRAGRGRAQGLARDVGAIRLSPPRDKQRGGLSWRMAALRRACATFSRFASKLRDAAPVRLHCDSRRVRARGACGAADRLLRADPELQSSTVTNKIR